jgi:tetratricopeptide (TPR) repeat protein
MSRPAITRLPARISYDAEHDSLHVCEFGAVAEERLEEQCVPIGERLRLFLRHRGGPVIGFGIAVLHEFDLDAGEPDLWGAPRFRVPALGLRHASVGEIALRARTVYDRRSTADVLAEARGREAEDPAEAELAFRESLDAGNLRAHLLIASSLVAQGRYAAGYDHARIFTELAPSNSWGWAWLGRICVELGAVDEARAALRRAIRLERSGSYRTPARRLLRSLS